MIEQIDEALCNRPFLPFTIRLVNGDTVPVTHPEAAHLFRTRPPVVAVLSASGKSVRILNAPLIMAIETDAEATPPPGGSNGRAGGSEPRQG